jgi:hypothetical protein
VFRKQVADFKLMRTQLQAENIKKGKYLDDIIVDGKI